MAQLFAPYRGSRPKILEINGNRVMIVARDEEVFDPDSLDAIGADKVKRLRLDGPEEFAIFKLSSRYKTGVVLANSDLDLSQVLNGLKLDLPWIQ
jgi:hypothetical protein